MTYFYFLIQKGYITISKYKGERKCQLAQHKYNKVTKVALE